MTPLFALVQIPKKEEFFSEYFNEQVFFSFVIRYVVIPFVLFYFFILYAYSFKVLLNFGDWPKGEVSWMVIGFSILGYIAYIFSYIYEGKNTLIQYFRKYFPYVVIPQLAMLFYAIYLRIAQYDLTMNRYLVVVFGIGLLCISLYYVFSREKKLAVTPAIITAFIILISIGPWSVYSLPLQRQEQRLTQYLQEANICSDNSCSEVTPLKNKTDISRELSENIYSSMRYVCNFDLCTTLKELFPQQYALVYAESKAEYDSWQKDVPEDEKYQYELSSWDIYQRIAEKLNIETNYYGSSEMDAYISYYNYESAFPLDISGYRAIYQLDIYEGVINDDNIYNLDISESETKEIDLIPIIADIRQKYSENKLDGINYIYE